MEPICIVRSNQTRALDREHYWARRFHNKKESIKLTVSYAIMLIFTIYLMFEIYPDVFRYWRYLKTDTLILYILSMVLYVSSLIRVVFQAQFFANKREKNRRKILGDRPSCSEYLFYGDRFLYRCNTSPSESWVVYAGVKKVKETANLYILITEDTMYSFNKAGFAKGSWEQVVQLLREKGSIK